MNFDKSAIEEANKHLLALNKRVLELEGTVTEQTEKLGNIEAEYQDKLQSVIRHKDTEIQQQNAWLESTQTEIRRLKNETVEKDSLIAELKKKCTLFDTAVRYKNELEGLLACFAEADKIRHKEVPLTPNSSPVSSDQPFFQPSNATANGINTESPENKINYKQVIWTPRAKDITSNNTQKVLNSGKKYSQPVKVPGVAVPNEESNNENSEAVDEETLLVVQEKKEQSSITEQTYETEI